MKYSEFLKLDAKAIRYCGYPKHAQEVEKLAEEERLIEQAEEIANE
jgi:hypothetical protein